jgi:hypothetical protein
VKDTKEDIYLWQRTTAEGLNAVKAQGHVNYSPYKVFRLLGHNDYRKQYDANYDDG